ncbi:hypothetical protein ACVMHR_002178 [Bradyrhizobium diazoefficiens]
MSVPGIGPSATRIFVFAASRISAIWCDSSSGLTGFGDAGGFRAEQRHEGVGHQRQHEADDVALLRAERVKHVGGLRDARHEVAVRDHNRRIGRIGVLQELDRCAVRVARST